MVLLPSLACYAGDAKADNFCVDMNAQMYVYSPSLRQLPAHTFLFSSSTLPTCTIVQLFLFLPKKKRKIKEENVQVVQKILKTTKLFFRLQICLPTRKYKPSTHTFAVFIFTEKVNKRKQGAFIHFPQQDTNYP